MQLDHHGNYSVLHKQMLIVVVFLAPTLVRAVSLDDMLPHSRRSRFFIPLSCLPLEMCASEGPRRPVIPILAENTSFGLLLLDSRTRSYLSHPNSAMCHVAETSLPWSLCDGHLTSARRCGNVDLVSARVEGLCCLRRVDKLAGLNTTHSVVHDYVGEMYGASAPHWNKDCIVMRRNHAWWLM